MISSHVQTISCTVSRVVHPREPFSDGQPRFCVLLTSIGKATGMLPFYPEAGTRLKLTGERREWNGELQFKFSRALHDAPADPKALLEYVASIAKGVGPKTAEKIWTQYGAEWQLHFDEMKPSVALPLQRTLNELAANKARSELTVYVISVGGSPRMADAAWAKWGEDAAATIEANPYLLATLPGIGFKTVDGDIRRHFNIGDEDVRRAVAAIDYALRDLMEQSGDSVVSRDALYSQFHELKISRAVASAALAKLLKSGRIQYVGMDKVTTSAVVAHEGDLYRYITDNILDNGTPAEESISQYWPDTEIKFDASQRNAIIAATSNLGLTVINGSAGSGKTTIIKAICRILEDRGCAVELCAFAGKAAARLREATGHHASTIHSMLAYSGDGIGFTAGNLHGRTVILDEASMVPSSLLYEITKRDPERLILVGDQAQLQPVGIGSPFHDVIDTLPAVVHTLTTCYRNKEAVFAAAAKIRDGLMPAEGKSRNEEFAVRRFDGPEAVHAFIEEKVRAGEIDFSQDLVLSPRNGEGEEPAAATVKSLNAAIQAIENPHEDGAKFLADDRVICTKNFPKLDIWNGTTGWITRVDYGGKPFFLPDGASEFDEIRLGEKEQQQAISPAWCLTVHKAQGSQYRDVYVVCLRRDGARLFDRSMLYTAVTRAKRRCVLLTDDGIDRIIGAVRRRRTFLQSLLKGEE